MAELVATTLWKIAPQLILALDGVFGGPVDSYVNGSQVWLSNDGPGEAMLEWRLHPVSNYRTPQGLSHYDVWEAVISAISENPSAPPEFHIPLGKESRPLSELWEGLECFCAYGDDVEPNPLAQAAQAALGIAPDYFGLVDHEALGVEFERTGGAVNLVSLLINQLRR